MLLVVTAPLFMVTQLGTTLTVVEAAVLAAAVVTVGVLTNLAAVAAVDVSFRALVARRDTEMFATVTQVVKVALVGLLVTRELQQTKVHRPAAVEAVGVPVAVPLKAAAAVAVGPLTQVNPTL